MFGHVFIAPLLTNYDRNNISFLLSCIYHQYHHSLLSLLPFPPTDTGIIIHKISLMILDVSRNFKLQKHVTRRRL